MPRPAKSYETHWLRPEYRDREEELVSVAEIASIDRVDRKVVSGWIMRYQHFPAPVKEVLTGRAPTKYFVTGEVVEWLLQHRPHLRRYEAARLQAYTMELDAEIDLLAQRMAHLTSVRDQIRAVIDERDTASLSPIWSAADRSMPHMRHPAERLVFPTVIATRTIAFLTWYFNDIHHGAQPVHHAECDDYDYDWRPRAGVSRLTLGHVPSGVVAMNAFDFTQLSASDVASAAPPFSLLLTTWFDLCGALDWIDEGTAVQMREALSELTSQDAYRFGQPIYG